MLLIKNGVDVFGEQVEISIKDEKIVNIRKHSGKHIKSRVGSSTENRAAENYIAENSTHEIEDKAGYKGVRTIDASGLVIAPGLVDMHVHFREPGFEYKEDMQSGAAAAAAGGVTTCCCMANTMPAADNIETINYIVERAKLACVNVLPIAAVTHKLKGKRLTSFTALKKAGAVAFSNDGVSIQNAETMRRAMQKARRHDYLIISHAEDEDIAKNYAVNEGAVSKRLNLPGRAAVAEDIMVARDVMIAKDTGARLHIAHVSTAGSADIIRRAKADGLKVTAETCPHYFTLTEDEVLRQGAMARVNPPLRTRKDIEAIKVALQDGTIDVIATDHAPHSMLEKQVAITDAQSGMIGLETSFSIALTELFHKKRLNLHEIISLMSTKPANILGIDAGELKVGGVADIMIFDPSKEWVVDANNFLSKSSNSPFIGARLRGSVCYTICKGKVVYSSM